MHYVNSSIYDIFFYTVILHNCDHDLTCTCTLCISIVNTMYVHRPDFYHANFVELLFCMQQSIMNEVHSIQYTG